MTLYLLLPRIVTMTPSLAVIDFHRHATLTPADPSQEWFLILDGDVIRHPPGLFRLES